jgi:hypothetical protein
VIFHTGYPGLASAIGTTIERLIRLYPMPDDTAAAVIADRGQLVNGTFETVESVAPARRDHLEGQIIIISANFALSHNSSLLSNSINCFCCNSVLQVQADFVIMEEEERIRNKWR